MPCPYFEPRNIAFQAEELSGGRLPLIDEYDGFCHLSAGRIDQVDAAVRLLGCNEGNRRRVCPAMRESTLARFTVLRRSRERLTILLVDDDGARPVFFQELQFDPASEQFAPEPDPSQICRRAQLLAFCRSYLARYPLS